MKSGIPIPRTSDPDPTLSICPSAPALASLHVAKEEGGASQRSSGLLRAASPVTSGTRERFQAALQAVKPLLLLQPVASSHTGWSPGGWLLLQLEQQLALGYQKRQISALSRDWPCGEFGFQAGCEAGPFLLVQRTSLSQPQRDKQLSPCTGSPPSMT